MTRPIPPEILTEIQAHEHWVKAGEEEGQQLALDDANLSDLDLSGRDLSTSFLLDDCFDRTLLIATDLSDTIMHRSSFVQANLEHAHLIDAEAWNCDFSEANMRGVQAISASFLEANLHKANLAESNLCDANLLKTNLEGTNFSYANMELAYLVEAHVAHAIFTGAYLEGAKLRGATGAETIEAEWIAIGSKEAPQRLEGKQAKQWLLEAAGKTLREVGYIVPDHADHRS